MNQREFRRGDTRSDGYRFVGYRWNKKRTKQQEEWYSPEAFARLYKKRAPRKYSTAPIGEKFGRWTVVGYSHEKQKGSSRGAEDFWLCRCDCGIERAVRALELVGHNSTSCGCYLVELMSSMARTHGCSGSKTYRAWSGLRNRVQNPANARYAYYGGRGITVCERWSSFENFLTDMGEPPDGHSIDRIDNNGNYEPSNCRWATQKEQCRNRRQSVAVEYQGQRKPLAEWCEILGVPLTRALTRLSRKWSVADALEKPPQKKSANPLGGTVRIHKRLYV